jgi:hypothetical protein
MAKGLVIALGKPGADKGSNAAREYAKEAYSALQDKDEEGFVEALLGLKSCAHSMPDEED